MWDVTYVWLMLQRACGRDLCGRACGVWLMCDLCCNVHVGVTYVWLMLRRACGCDLCVTYVATCMWVWRMCDLSCSAHASVTDVDYFQQDHYHVLVHYFRKCGISDGFMAHIFVMKCNKNIVLSDNNTRIMMSCWLSKVVLPDVISDGSLFYTMCNTYYSLSVLPGRCHLWWFSVFNNL